MGLKAGGPAGQANLAAVVALLKAHANPNDFSFE